MFKLIFYLILILILFFLYNSDKIVENMRHANYQHTPQRQRHPNQRQRHPNQRHHSYSHPRYSRPYNYNYNYRRGFNYIPFFYTGYYESDTVLLDTCMNIMTNDMILKYEVKNIADIKTNDKEETVRVKISRCFDQFIIGDKLYLLDSYPSLINAYNIYMA